MRILRWVAVLGLVLFVGTGVVLLVLGLRHLLRARTRLLPLAR